MSFKDQINTDNLPQHIAIIMDGNGRWAKQRGKLRLFGHKHGVTSVRETTEAAAEMGLSYLTLYAFSTENWKQAESGSNMLYEAFGANYTSGRLKLFMKIILSLQAIGDLESLPM